jgi:hypothetical protein
LRPQLTQKDSGGKTSSREDGLWAMPGPLASAMTEVTMSDNVIAAASR